MSRDAWQILAALIVLGFGFGVAGARAQSSVDEQMLAKSSSSRPTEIAARNATCPHGTVYKKGYCAEGEAPPEKQAKPPPLLRSPAQQIENVIQSIRSLQHKCGPTQVWSAQEKVCIEND
jgi:hypothetical protein